MKRKTAEDLFLKMEAFKARATKSYRVEWRHGGRLQRGSKQGYVRAA
jgi:hypothetical protein